MCTGILLKSTDDKVFWGRTQEFDLDLVYQGVVIPRNYTVADTLTSFKTKYALAGISIKDYSATIDGVNEHGLSGGSFYFANYNQYSTQAEIETDGKMALRGQEIVLWALANCATLAEVKVKLQAEIAIAEGDYSFPQHFVFQNQVGESLVVEPSVKGSFKFFDNPIGIFTNNPPFDWHLTNLQNYVGLSNQMKKGTKLAEMDVFSPGKGSGLIGLPGDSTPQSRFVRATAIKFLADKVESNEIVSHMFHMFNSFDITKGVVQTAGPLESQTAQYTVVYDLEKQQIFIHTYGNHQIQTFKMDEKMFDKKTITRFEIQEEQEYLQMSMLD